MADNFKVIETQEQLDAIIGERLSRERSKFEDKFKDYISPDQLADKTKELTDQIAGLTGQLNDADGKYKDYESKLAERDATIKKYETDSVKTRCLVAAGLSTDFIGRVQGETEEDIQKDVEALKGLVGNRQAPPLKQPDLPPENGVVAAFKKINPNITI